MDLTNGRIMHIDTSKRFFQRGDTGIAYKMINSGEHKGLYLSERRKRELDKTLGCQDDYARLYAICIYTLIKDSLDNFDCLVICNDEYFLYVKLYLDLLFMENTKYLSKQIINISKLRQITGERKLRSAANNVANLYRRKGTMCIQRKQKGIPLNEIKISYQQTCELWETIEKRLKKRKQ